jgi:hypothetical protein
MTPSETLAAARHAGISLTIADDGRLRVRSREALPDDLKAAVLQHKTALAMLLADEGKQAEAAPQSASACSNCKRSDWWQRPDGGWVCGVCHPDPQKLRAAWEARRQEASE